MSIFDKIRKPNEKIETSDLLKQLTNLTGEDIVFLKKLASGDIETVSKNRSEYLNLIDKAFERSFSYGENSPQTRKQLYQVYDEMDESVSYISAALDIISDDATQADQDGYVIKIYTESEKVLNLTQQLIDDLEIEEKLAKWARVVAKYGDFFIKISTEEGKGITKILDTIYPSKIERYDFDGELVAFKDSDNITDQIYSPWEFVHFKHKGEITRNQSRDISSIGEFTLEHSLTSSYGQSILRPAIKVYAQLRFVENMILLSRLTNSIRRNVFMINVGDVSPDKAEETIRNYANLLKKNVSLNLEEGIYNSQKKTFSYDEDIFIPVSDPKNDVRIEQVGGDANISEQYDLEYLLNKLFSALKIPKAYLNYEQDLNARATLIQLDIRYARSVSRLQQTLRGGLIRLAKINLAFFGIDPNSVELDIQLTPVSTIDAESKRQEMQAKIEVANSLWRTFVDINDKLSGDSKGGSPLDFLGGGITEGKETTEDNKTPIDLNYAAELLFSDYIGLSKEEIESLFRRETEDKKSKDKGSIGKTVTFRRIKSSDPDIHAPYPNEENIKVFEKLREELLRNKNQNE